MNVKVGVEVTPSTSTDSEEQAETMGKNNKDAIIMRRDS